MGKNKENLISFGFGQPDFLLPSSIMEGFLKNEDFFMDLFVAMRFCGGNWLRGVEAMMYDDFLITNGARRSIGPYFVLY